MLVVSCGLKVVGSWLWWFLWMIVFSFGVRVLIGGGSLLWWWLVADGGEW